MWKMQTPTKLVTNMIRLFWKQEEERERRSQGIVIWTKCEINMHILLERTEKGGYTVYSLMCFWCEGLLSLPDCHAFAEVASFRHCDSTNSLVIPQGQRQQGKAWPISLVQQLTGVAASCRCPRTWHCPVPSKGAHLPSGWHNFNQKSKISSLSR